MILNVKLVEKDAVFDTNFGEVHNVSDGGFERGYAEGETKGYQKGYTEGETKGFEDGAKSEYDRFWDNFQQNGTRTAYGYAFRAWTEELFKPKYDITPAGYITGVFNTANIPDLKGILESRGVKLDTSKCTALLQWFQDSSVKYIPEIDARKSGNNNYLFYTSSIITIDKLICSEATHFSSTTFNAKNLESVIIEGTIGVNGFNVSYSPKLSYESLMSIINSLKDFSGTGETRTCTLGATNLAKLTDAEKAIATEKGWTLA